MALYLDLIDQIDAFRELLFELLGRLQHLDRALVELEESLPDTTQR